MDEILSTLDRRCYDLVLSVGPARETTLRINI